MQCPSVPPNEAARLSVLHELRILDTPAEADFDGLTALLASILRVPIALISIVDESRQWFKSHHGLAARETPRDVSFCGHVVANNEQLVVGDAYADKRFHDNPLVTGDPHVRFYAGMPLRTEEGFVLGTLCAIDHVPRQLLEPELKLLSMLARQVTIQLELRRRNFELERRREQELALQEELRGSLSAKETLLRQLEQWTLTLEQRVHERTLDLVRSREELAVTVDSLADGVIAADRDMRIVRMNRVAERLTGWSQREAEGMPLAEVFNLVDELSGDALESRALHVLREPGIGESTGRTLLHARDASTCPIAESVAPISGTDGAVRGVVIVFRDVRAERTTRNALRASEKKYRTLYDNLVDMCATIDMASERVVDCNATLCRVLGYSKDELIGRPISELYAAECHAAQAIDRLVFEQAQELHDRERVLLCKDGRGIEASLSATALVSAEGHAHALAVWRDISARKQADRDRQFLAGFSDLQRLSDVPALAAAAALAISEYLGLDRAVLVEIDLDLGLATVHSHQERGSLGMSCRCVARAVL